MIISLLFLANYCKNTSNLKDAEKYASRLLDYSGKEKEEAKALLREIQNSKAKNITFLYSEHNFIRSLQDCLEIKVSDLQRFAIYWHQKYYLSNKKFRFDSLRLQIYCLSNKLTPATKCIKNIKLKCNKFIALSEAPS